MSADRKSNYNTITTQLINLFGISQDQYGKIILYNKIRQVEQSQQSISFDITYDEIANPIENIIKQYINKDQQKTRLEAKFQQLLNSDYFKTIKEQITEIDHKLLISIKTLLTHIENNYQGEQKYPSEQLNTLIIRALLLQATAILQKIMENTYDPELLRLFTALNTNLNNKLEIYTGFLKDYKNNEPSSGAAANNPSRDSIGGGSQNEITDSLKLKDSKDYTHKYNKYKDKYRELCKELGIK
jgi:hypothetical protein